MGREYRIDISPDILQLLGPSLYTNIYYVLAELIANAYDADAHNVYIIESDDRIIVEDDGLGMDYGKGVKRYLDVASPTRTKPEDDLTPAGRKKMGRKGVGKLAALSVSNDVTVLTVGPTDKSGFVLTREVPRNRMLKPIPEEDIVFSIPGHNEGTSIIMENPEYRPHKTLEVQKRNLLRMFPVIGGDFKIHLILGDKKIVLEEFDEAVIPQLTTLITVGDEYRHFEDKFVCDYQDIRDKVLVHFDESDLVQTVQVKNRDGKFVDCDVAIRGWIGTYKTTTNRKKNPDDFPDNYLSLFANGKLGSFNIIPEISANRMSESYVVGQLHIDCFERTDLPDMAMSNRQGYKTEDPRYQAAITVIRSELFNRIINMRDVYTERKKKSRDAERYKKQKDNEADLKKKASEFVKEVSDGIAKRLEEDGSADNVERIASKSVEGNLGLLGLKGVVDSDKKKLLISHASCDKPLADLIYNLLLLNNVNPADIIYTSVDDHEESRVPEGRSIYDYLRDFFVSSVSAQMINVVFVTSEESSHSWSPVCEVGAAWVTRADHKVFNVEGHTPGKPLDDASEWHTSRIVDDEIHMTRRAADVMKVKIREICKSLGVCPLDDATIANLIYDRVIIDD